MDRIKIKVKYRNFWNGFNPVHHCFFKNLYKDYEVEHCDSPDMLFFSVFSKTGKLMSENLPYDCTRVFFTHECVKPNYDHCDYSFSFESANGKNYQISNIYDYEYFDEFLDQIPNEKLQKLQATEKTKFCNFIYFNEKAQDRINFCKQLTSYKRVDSPGKVLNNLSGVGKRYGGAWAKDKLDFIKNYKFTIAFENQSSPGYVTEKIFHPFLVKSIPIYWGDPEVTAYFNPESFVNCHDFKDFDEVIQKVTEIDNNDDLYQQYISAPPILPTSKIFNLKDAVMADRLKKLIKGLKT